MKGAPARQRPKAPTGRIARAGNAENPGRNDRDFHELWSLGGLIPVASDQWVYRTNCPA